MGMCLTYYSQSCNSSNFAQIAYDAITCLSQLLACHPAFLIRYCLVNPPRPACDLPTACAIPMPCFSSLSWYSHIW